MKGEPSVLRNSGKAELSERWERNLEVVNECMAAASSVFESTIRTKGFDDTVRDRGFLTEVWSHGEKREALAEVLFGLRPEKNIGALQATINGKRILVVGGGASMDDLLSDNRFAPALLLNVDPFLVEEKPARGAAGYYRSLPLDAASADFLQALQAGGHDTFDEIWATWSVPHYCKTPDEVARYFANMFKALEPGGTLRICPVTFVVDPMPPIVRTAVVAELASALSASLRTLAQMPNVEMSRHDNTLPDGRILPELSTLIIHKTAFGNDRHLDKAGAGV
ncbi:hypothetical protein HY971_01700 [Candidatus Kaiserbacteria bacterium]|nr:hypothetical protein [Candidatus Kaiserbacteria bacterium]